MGDKKRFDSLQAAIAALRGGSKAAFDALYSQFVGKVYHFILGIPENAVLVNVWNWDPRWRVKVTENGAELPVTWKNIEDPLHTLSYDVPRTAENGEYTSSFRTLPTCHIFMVRASSATSTLEIEVEDQFGNIYRESMERPRQFTTDK